MCTPMGKIRTWAAVLAVLASISAAHAQGVPIGALPNAATPLSGSELTILSQNGQTVKATVNQVVAPGITIPNNTVLGNVSGLTAAATSLTASQIDSLLGLGTAAFNSIGTSGGTVPLLSGANTWSALQAFNGGITISSLSIGTLTVTTSFTSSGTSLFSGAVTMTPAAGAVAIGPTTTGTINNMTIGATTRAAISGTTGNFNSTLLATGHVTFEGVTSTGATGTGALVFGTSPTLASPTFSGTVAGSNTIPLSILAQVGTNTVLGNFTSGTANITAQNVLSCSTSASALSWTTNTGFGCNTAVNAAQLNGATFASPGPIGGSAPGTVVTTGLTLSSTTSPITLNASAGLAGNALLSAGPGATPTWGTITSVYPAWGGAQTVAFNAVSGTAYCVDTKTTGAVTMTLPASPADGDQIRFIDCKSNFGVANFTVARNGHTIMGLASDMTVATPNATATLIYVTAYTDWRMY